MEKGKEGDGREGNGEREGSNGIHRAVFKFWKRKIHFGNLFSSMTSWGMKLRCWSRYIIVLQSFQSMTNSRDFESPSNAPPAPVCKSSVVFSSEIAAYMSK